MNFIDFFETRKRLNIGDFVYVQYNNKWDKWRITGLNSNTAKVYNSLVGRTIEVPQTTLIQWQQKFSSNSSPVPAHDLPKDQNGYVDVAKIGKPAYNKWFWDRISANAPRTPEFYIEKVQDWLRYQGMQNDFAVVDRDPNWYKQRVAEIMQKVKSYKGPIFRCISCKDPKNADQEIDWNRVGLSWAFEESGAQCYLATNKGIPVKIQGHISGPEAIDMDTTILYYLVPQYMNEKEFRLKRGADVQVIQGEIQSGDFYTPNKTVALNIMAKA